MAYTVALKKLGSPQDAADLMQDVLLNYLSGKNAVKPVPLKSALSYFVKEVQWDAADMANRGRTRNRNHSPTLDAPAPGGEEGETEATRGQAMVDQVFDRNPYWYDDPGDYKLVGRLFEPGFWKSHVVPALARVHPDMPLFFDRLLDDPKAGMNTVVRDLPNYPQGKDHAGYGMWLKMLRSKVGPLMRELAEGAAAEGEIRTAGMPRPVLIRVRTQWEGPNGRQPVTILGDVLPVSSGWDGPSEGGVESVEMIDAHGKALPMDKDDKRWAEELVMDEYNRKNHYATAEGRQAAIAAARADWTNVFRFAAAKAAGKWSWSVTASVDSEDLATACTQAVATVGPGPLAQTFAHLASAAARLDHPTASLPYTAAARASVASVQASDLFALPADLSPRGIDAWLSGVRLELGDPPNPAKIKEALDGLAYAAYLLRSKPAAKAKVQQEIKRLEMMGG